MQPSAQRDDPRHWLDLLWTGVRPCMLCNAQLAFLHAAHELSVECREVLDMVQAQLQQRFCLPGPREGEISGTTLAGVTFTELSLDRWQNVCFSCSHDSFSYAHTSSVPAVGNMRCAGALALLYRLSQSELPAGRAHVTLSAQGGCHAIMLLISMCPQHACGSGEAGGASEWLPGAASCAPLVGTASWQLNYLL